MVLEQTIMLNMNYILIWLFQNLTALLASTGDIKCYLYPHVLTSFISMTVVVAFFFNRGYSQQAEILRIDSEINRIRYFNKIRYIKTRIEFIDL